jgi:outer membrane biosynthesis protein TonB
MVEPEVPQRLLDQLSNPEVHLEFTIEADGSVSGITLLSPAPRLLPFLREAIEQWRYAPLPESRRHRVTLIFGR